MFTLRDSVAIVRTAHEQIPLAMIAMRKFIHGRVSFSFLYEYGAPLGARAPLLIKQVTLSQKQ